MDQAKAWEVPPPSPLPDVRGTMHLKKRGRSISLKGQGAFSEMAHPQAPALKKSRIEPKAVVQPENEQLKLMVVDFVIEDGAAATGSRGEGGRPPRALLYGLTAEGQSVCCHVSGD